MKIHLTLYSVPISERVAAHIYAASNIEIEFMLYARERFAAEQAPIVASALLNLFVYGHRPGEL